MLSNYAKGFLAGKRDEKRDRIPSLIASFLKGFFAMMKDPDQSVEDPISPEENALYERWANLVWRPWLLLSCVKARHEKGQSLKQFRKANESNVNLTASSSSDSVV